MIPRNDEDVVAKMTSSSAVGSRITVVPSNRVMKSYAVYETDFSAIVDAATSTNMSLALSTLFLTTSVGLMSTFWLYMSTEEQAALPPWAWAVAGLSLVVGLVFGYYVVRGIRSLRAIIQRVKDESEPI